MVLGAGAPAAPFYLLEDRFETWLAKAHDVNSLAGEPRSGH
jgi:hypothetical protein